MHKKTVSGIMMTLLFIGMFSLAISVKPAKSTWTGTVYIRADGSIDPPDAPIITYDNITYTLTDNITSSGDGIVVERDNIIIDGKEHLLSYMNEGEFVGIRLENRKNITVKNLQIQNFGMGILLASSSSHKIFGNEIINNKYGIGLLSSTNNSIFGNYIASNYGGIGLGIFSNNNSISRNNLTGNIEYGIWLDYKCSSNIIFRNNVIGNKRYGICLYYSLNNSIIKNDIINGSIGISLIVSPNSEVLENYVRNVEGGIYLSCSPNSTVLRNIVINSHGISIPIKRSPNSRIIGNTIMKSSISPAVPYDGGIFLIESNNSIVQENEIIENNHGGIWLFSSHCCRVQGNMVRDNHGRGSAIYLYLSEGCMVHDNKVVNNTGNGIEFYSNNTIITKNTISDNTIAGIAFLGQNNTLFANNISNHHGFFGAGVIVGSGSIDNVIISNNLYENDIGIWFDGEPDASVFNNTVSNNLIVGNGKGLRLDYSYSSTIHFNALINNEYGIYLLESYGNYIYHNNFINNTEQVYDLSWEYPDVSPSINFWDYGYPSGGNYWSDYNGTDFYSGPFQNETGNDGIGDTPYVIDENNVDHYPLMTPYAITPPVPSVINAIVDVNPKALNLRSKGKWITAYIELPEGYNVSDIDVSTIMLNDTISAEPKPIAVGNHDEDGILDLMIKFDRANVISYILANVNKTKLFDERFIAVTLTITGYLNDGTLFQGTTTIRVLMPIPFFVSRHWRFCRTL